MQALRDEIRLLASRLEKSDQEGAEAREALVQVTNRARGSEWETQRAYVESALLALPCDKCADLGVAITTTDGVRLCAKCVRLALGEYLVDVPPNGVRSGRQHEEVRDAQLGLQAVCAARCAEGLMRSAAALAAARRSWARGRRRSGRDKSPAAAAGKVKAGRGYTYNYTPPE